MFDIVSCIRKLAKSDYYQTLYNQEKYLGLKLFKNDIDLTQVQLYLLKYLRMYSGLCLSISMSEVPSTVLEKEIYEESYIYYKNKNRKKKALPEEVMSTSNPNKKRVMVNSSQWVFKNKK